MAIFFTADTHFSHANILKYCNRPFKDVSHMDETLIANWNRVVGINDEVYHVGDFAFTCTQERARAVRARLNGRIHLILGNHDKLAKNMPYSAWASISDLKEINVEKQKIVLCHYALRTWHHSYRGTWHVFGHSHGGLPSYGKSLDVGVDCWDYTPVSFAQLKKKMDTLINIHVIPEDQKWDKEGNHDIGELQPERV